jgi:bone morphogenetic protein 7
MLLSSKNVTTHYDGWLELNVTSALKRWIQNKKSNKGLVIRAFFVEKPDHEIKLDDVGLINSKGDDEYQPFMVGYFKGQEV